MLNPGQRAPEFKAEAYYPSGAIHVTSLHEYRSKWLVLFFWPLDFTYVCPTEIRAYNDLYTEFEHCNCAVLGVSIDSAHVHRAWTQQGLGKMSFPLIGDVQRLLVEEYDVLHDDGVALRATYIIDPQGIVQSVSANGLNVGRSARETLRLVKAFQSGAMTPCEWQPGQAYVVPV